MRERTAGPSVHARPLRLRLPGSELAYLGTTTARQIIVLPDGEQLPERSLSKVTGEERGADGVIARLTARGAAPLEEGSDRTLWLPAALHACGARRLRHAGKHKYAIRIGRTQAERSRALVRA